jgi:hypothetical protein
MKRTASIQLSAQFIVMLIISIIVFAFGIGFVSRLSDKAMNMPDEMLERDRSALWDMLSSGERVAIYPISAEASSRNPAVFNIGIENTLGEKRSFAIYIRFSGYFDKKGKQVCSSSPCNSDNMNEWILTTLGQGKYNPPGLLLEFDSRAGNQPKLKANDRKEMLVMISPSKRARTGTYVFDLIVAHDTHGAPPPPFDNPDGLANCKDATSDTTYTQPLSNCQNEFLISKLYDSQIHKLYVEII